MKSIIYGINTDTFIKNRIILKIDAGINKELQR